MSWYDANAAALSARYEAVAPASLYEWVADLLPAKPSLILDIGAGTGRDAAWFASSGHEVVAVEPSSAMRAEGARRHDVPRITWVVDSLPSLSATLRLGLAADVVLLSGVWQHVAPGERDRAFRKLVTLLRSGGLLILSLRHGPDDGRGAHEVSADEVERLARDYGMQVVRRNAADAMGRPEVRWTNFALRLPDDGTGALPLLRHIILVDQKSATYKLGLLRAICRAADGSAGMAIDDGDEYVRLPLGLIALNWLRLYLPLVTADLPQSPANLSGAEALGFAGSGWNELAIGVVSQRDLRIGTTFSGPAAKAVSTALREASNLIRRMPAFYLTFAGGGRIFEVASARLPRLGDTLTINYQTLAAFGTMRVPRNIWRAMQRFAAWIEPALIAEWARQMQQYAASQGRSIDAGALAAAMIWSDPERATAIPRSIAQKRIQLGEAVHCVWSGKRLTEDNLDIDHCFPWSAWPCNDLWNLMPAHRSINQRDKRERLPSAEALRKARDEMLSWWATAYLSPGDLVLPRRFGTEARASLPGLVGLQESCDLEEVFAALRMQQVRLRQDQGVPEWSLRG